MNWKRLALCAMLGITMLGTAACGTKSGEQPQGNTELYIVGIIKHREIIQPKVPGYASGSLRDLLLNTSI